MKIKYLFFFALMLSSTCLFAQKQYTLQSPDANITVTIDADEELTYSVMHGSTQILAPSAIAMSLDNGKVLGENPKVISTKTNSINEVIKANFYKKAEIVDNYNELSITFQGRYKVIFRAYDDGVAYRFVTYFPGTITVESETADFNFDADYTALVPYVNARRGEGDFINQQFFTSFENVYTTAFLLVHLIHSSCT